MVFLPRKFLTTLETTSVSDITAVDIFPKLVPTTIEGNILTESATLTFTVLERPTNTLQVFACGELTQSFKRKTTPFVIVEGR